MAAALFLLAGTSVTSSAINNTVAAEPVTEPKQTIIDENEIATGPQLTSTVQALSSLLAGTQLGAASYLTNSINKKEKKLDIRS